MRCETTSPGVQECALCASSVYHVQHASVCVNVVIGVLVVLCELHVIVRVHVIPLCGDVVGLTLGLIAHVVVVVFVVAILHRIFCVGRYILYMLMPVSSQAIHSHACLNSHHSDIQGTAQKSPRVNTF